MCYQVKLIIDFLRILRSVKIVINNVSINRVFPHFDGKQAKLASLVFASLFQLDFELGSMRCGSLKLKLRRTCQAFSLTFSIRLGFVVCQGFVSRCMNMCEYKSVALSIKALVLLLLLLLRCPLTQMPSAASAGNICNSRRNCCLCGSN